MIEISGQMSGGGRPKKGLMCHKIVEEFSDSQIFKIKEKIEASYTNLYNLKKEYMDLET